MSLKEMSKGSDFGVEHIVKCVADISLDGSEDGDWEQVIWKNRNISSGPTANKWAANASSNAWEQPVMVQKQDMRGSGGSAKVPSSAWNSQIPDNRIATGKVATAGYENKNLAAAMPSPLKNEWNWSGRTAPINTKSVNNEVKELVSADVGDLKDDSDDDDDAYSDDDDDLLSDDSDDSPKSFAARKNHRMLKAFFEVLDRLAVEEISEPERRWHCPACQGGPGAIEWFRGLQSLMTHAKTKGSIRVKLHREFADLLEEELCSRGAVVQSVESFGQWQGLKQESRDFEIVWPPMVIIMNTRLEKDENDKWIGMGNPELLDYFSSYHAVKARHSYGPQGHRGMSVLIFENSAVGYLEAERLHKHFIEQGTGRDAWGNPHRNLFHTAGRRQLYGFLAVKEDMDIFNQHCQGKSKLKFDLCSYKEMVVSQMKQMSEDNQQLNWYKNKVVKVRRETKAYEETVGILSEKLRMVSAQNRIVRQRTKMQWEQNKEEMVFQEQFFRDQIKKIHEATDAKEDDFEKLQQEGRKKVELSSTNASTVEDLRCRAENLESFNKIHEAEMEAFNAEREKLMEVRNIRMNDMKKRYWEEEVEIEKGYYAALSELMEKYRTGLREDAEDCM
ncbi:Protein SUPPRESSOR OF GENE SILENCING [Dionaea muscipula]